MQQQGKKSSADDIVRGGAGGSLRCLGGGINPGSSVPSPANAVPAHSVATNTGMIYFFIHPFNFVTKLGGLGGFLHSDRDIGVVHPPGTKFSLDDIVLGGAGGSFLSRGGATKPFSLVPSPANTVPAKSVALITAVLVFIMVLLCCSTHTMCENGEKVTDQCISCTSSPVG